MNTIGLLQIMAVLYFVFAVRMQVWQTSLNTFVVIAAIFFIVITREIAPLRTIWADYHFTIIALLMTFLMARVVWQKSHKTYKNSNKSRGYTEC